MLKFLYVFIFSTIYVFSNTYLIRTDDKNTLLQLKNQFNSEITQVADHFKEANFKNFPSLLNNDKAIYYLNKIKSYYKVNIDNIEVLNKIENIKNLEIYQNRKFKISTSELQYPNIAKKLWNLNQLNISKAWKTATGKGIVISLVDTGIDFNHQDLKNSLWINPKEDLNNNGTFEPWSYLETRNGITGDLNGIDEDGNGYIDDIIGYDFVDQIQVAYGDFHNPDPIPEDEGNHGTNVASIMVAKPATDTSIVGISYNSKLMIAKAFDITGNAESDDIAIAIVYSVLNGANIINMSFGDDYPSQIVYDAIKFAYYSGCVLVASSGNNGWNLPHYPSDYPEVISVGGSDERLQKWGFSNYGPYLDILAPARLLKTANTNNSYKTTNGTSIAAPHISSAAALLLEINNTLTNEDIKMILKSTAFDNIGYDSTYSIGAGILDINKSLKNPFKSILKFENINFDDILYDEDLPKNINISVTHPLFDKVEFLISNSSSRIIWKKITEINSQILNKSFVSLTSNLLTNGQNLLCIRLHLKNQKFIDEIIPVNYYSKKNEFKYEYFNNYQAFKNEKRIYIIGANTNRPATFYVNYKLKNSQNLYSTVKEFNRFSNSHQLIIEDLKSNEIYSATAVAISGKDTIFKEFEFSIDDGYFTTKNFRLKPYNSARSYLNNNVTNLYSNGKKTFAVNDFSNLFIGKTFTRQIIDNKIVNVDSLDLGYIPVGFGDSNGDGIPEILSTAEYNTILYQAKNKYGNPFETILYRNAQNTSLWSEQFFDIDKDGIDEIIGYTYEVQEKEYKVIKYQNGNYEKIASARLPDKYASISIERGSALEDLDGDGNYELAFVNTRGNLFIYEFKNNKFELEYIDSTNLGFSNQYVTKADINGDGIYEILHGTYGTVISTGTAGYTDAVWNFRIIKSNGYNNYSIIWSESFYPVRDGATRQNIFYRNGIAAGNLDNEAGDEIVLIPFPNLYVLKWNKSTQKFDNFWYYPSALSNTALIADMDGNGINELGFTTFNALRFFEFTGNKSIPEPPINLDGWAETQTTAYLEWESINIADKFYIYQLIAQNGEIIPFKIAETNSKSIFLDNLKPNSFYDFVLTTFNNNFSTNESDFSNVISIATTEKTLPISYEVISPNTIKLSFMGTLPVNSINPAYFLLENSSINLIPSSVNIYSKNIALINFNENLKNGDYNLHIYKFRDFYRNFSTDTIIKINIDIKGADEEIYLKKLEFLSETLIKIYFSEEIDSLSATNRNNYVFSPFGEALFVELDPIEKNAILINISQLFRNNGARGINYTIQARNIKSKSGKNITKGAGSILGFVIYANNLQNAYVYPNPLRISEVEQIIFANLSPSAKVTIKTLDGVEINTLLETDGNGGVEWDLRDKNGNLLGTGIYLFEVEGTDINGINLMPFTGKFVIIP